MYKFIEAVSSEIVIIIKALLATLFGSVSVVDVESFYEEHDFKK